MTRQLLGLRDAPRHTCGLGGQTISKAVEAPPGLCMGRAAPPLCGKLLGVKDRRVWQQAIAMLMGLKIRHGFGEKDLAAAVAAALRRSVDKHTCEDCMIKVASGAASSYERVSGGGLTEGAEQSPWAGDLAIIPIPGWHVAPTSHTQSPA